MVARTGVGAALLLLQVVASVAAAGCGADTYMAPPLPLDAGLVGDTSPRPLAVVGDRSSDRLELFALEPHLQRVAQLSLDDHPDYVDEPFDLAVAPDGKVLYVVLGHGTAWTAGKLLKVRLADGVRLGELELGEEPSMIALSGDGRRAYVTLFRNLDHPQGPWSDPGALVVVDTEAMRVHGQVEVCAAALGVALDEDRKRAWVACAGSGEVALVDVSSDAAPRLERTVALDDGGGGKGTQAAYLALASESVLVTAQGTGDVWIFDRATAALRQRLAFGSDAFPQRLAMLDAGTAAVALDGHQQIQLVDVGRLLPGLTFELPGVHPQGLAVTPTALLVTDEADLQHPGRLVKLELDCRLRGGSGCPDPEYAATEVFPQAVVVVR